MSEGTPSVPEEIGPWLESVSRRYGFTEEHLARALGCEGDKVVKVEHDTGLWYVTTREKTK